MKKILLFILLIIFLIPNAYANTCTTEEVRRLTELANRVKVNYEVGKIWVDNLASNEGGPEKLEENNFYLNVYNISKDLFILITNNKNTERISVSYNDTTNGKYVLDTRNNLYNIAEYTFEIYAQNQPCKLKLLKTLKFTKPKTNVLYYYDECQDNLNVPICSEYITKDINYISKQELKEQIEKYKKNNLLNTTTTKTIQEKNFLDSYKYYLLSFIIIIGVILGSVIINKKRRKL